MLELKIDYYELDAKSETIIANKHQFFTQVLIVAGCKISIDCIL